MREDYHVGYTTDKALFTQYKANPSSVLVLNAERFYTKFEPKWHIFDIKVRQIVFLINWLYWCRFLIQLYTLFIVLNAVFRRKKRFSVDL